MIIFCFLQNKSNRDFTKNQMSKKFSKKSEPIFVDMVPIKSEETKDQNRRSLATGILAPAGTVEKINTGIMKMPSGRGKK